MAPWAPPGALISAFVHTYGVQPAACARAPGRVNLIGEHIDYEGYGVMPMAIEQACCVAIGWRPDTSAAALTPAASPPQLHVANLAAQYPAGVLPLQADAPSLPAGTPSWLTYVWAAYKGCAEFAAAKQWPMPGGASIDAMVGSDVPPAAGLSSSSALVVAAAMALLALWQLPASPTEVAELACRCERFVGTQGGGMDQAVSCLAQQGVAMHVEFNPVRAGPVPLPAGGVFIVANSLTHSAKAETASHRFNLRVLECRLAAMLLAKRLNDAGCDWQQVTILRQVEQQLLQLGAASAAGAEHQRQQQQQQLAAAVDQLLQQQSYQFDEVATLLGTSPQQLLDLLPPALQAAAAGPLHLKQRALHVFAEAQRVCEFEAVCRDASLADAQKLQQLGALLDASHASCAGLYQCSCTELDKLVETARAAGALGSRLTGAGWGGCTVSLVREEDAPKFIAQLREAYFMPLVAAGVVKEEELPECLFASKPASGAAVMQLSLAEQPDEADTPAAAAEPAVV